MSAEMLLLPVLAPALLGLCCLVAVRRSAVLAVPLFLTGAALNLVAVLLMAGHPLAYELSFGAFDMPLSFRLDAFSSFILVSAASLGAVLALFTARFMAGRPVAGPFFGFFLLTLSLLEGAVLSDHLVSLLFFWEGMLGAMFAMIAMGLPGAWRTSVKAFFINGVADLCLMAGIGLVFHLAGTFRMAELAARPLPAEGLAGLAFVLMTVGALAKAGSMPFHSWIPDAANDAPLPFMALMPGAMEKLLGVYFLARLSLQLFSLGEGWAGMMLMVVGAVTILLAVAMALVQKDFKRLLSFHAISQVGYMVLGIGTGVPFGVVGGLFHMLNNALYKSLLFLTGGSVERQAGTTDLNQLGGLKSRMPLTAAFFLVAAFSISGFPLTNGFYSKELIYEGALHRHWIFYAAASLGSLLTAASFLKLGHAAFFGPLRAPAPKVEEAPLSMLVPMGLIAAACLTFGVGNGLIIEGAIGPALGIDGGHYAGALPHNWALVLGTLVVLGLAFANHLWGVKRSGSGLHAADHIHHAPGARQLYDLAARRFFDPYEITLKLVSLLARLLYAVDRGVDWLYNGAAVAIANGASSALRQAHTGSHALYLVWSLLGAALVVLYFVGGF